MRKQFAKSLILLSFILSVLILSGCADKRYLKAGDNFITQGQYEQAVEKYQRALAKEPDDKDIIAKLEQAQSLFEIWLDKIELSARQAEENNHFGKAQLLYAKLAEHRNNQNYRQKNRDLKKYNLKHHGLKIKLSIDQPQLAQRFGEQLDHIMFIQNITLSAKNEIALAFSLSKINFEEHETSQQISQDYISHYNTVANPEYQHLQEDIVVQEEEINSLQLEADDLYQAYDSQNNTLTLLDKDRQILALTMSQGSVEEYDQLVPEYDALISDIDQAQQIADQIDGDIYMANQNIEQYGKKLDYLSQSLQQTPETYEEAAYSNYQYQLKTVQQLMTSQLKMTVNSDVNSTYERQYLLQVEYTDSHHEAHQTIGLAKDPLQLKSQPQLTEMLHAKGRNKIITLILSELDKYQQELIAQANNASTIALQFDQWLIAGSINKKGLPNITNKKVEQQLLVEFGQGGILNVQALLNAQ